MLDTLNGLGETAWAGIVALVTVILGAIGAAYKGSKKSPVDVGQPLPPADQTPYILKELRELNRKHDDGSLQMGARFDRLDRKADENCKLVDERFDNQDRLMGRIYTDTQVLRERGSR
ncbi:hypothetical protein [Paracoccus marcusii]|uniref:Uncharacterized protein n=1 Tax=Paracoccus marcusii TaxID=59779 RepID=A0ABY7UQV2_9RHOB|nr:hypothetical protein [Paracoccus marcusii]WDA11395.1 hypothetical protein PRL19_08685 [Paracoccus marcusii]